LHFTQFGWCTNPVAALNLHGTKGQTVLNSPVILDWSKNWMLLPKDYHLMLKIELIHQQPLSTMFRIHLDWNDINLIT
jgi:hypothetical protein